MNDDYEYEYEYTAEEHNPKRQDTYSQRAYSGQGEELIFTKKKLTADEELLNFNNPTVYSEHQYKDSDLDHALAHMSEYNRFIIRCWDLVRDPIETGTIIRFENTRTNQRSADFRLTLMEKQFQRNLKSNADRIREELDAEISRLDSYSVNGIRRWSGSTKSGSLQMIVYEIGNQVRIAYLGIADQVFIPLTNRWQEITRGSARYDYQQSLDISGYDAPTIIRQLRGF